MYKLVLANIGCRTASLYMLHLKIYRVLGAEVLICYTTHSLLYKTRSIYKFSMSDGYMQSVTMIFNIYLHFFCQLTLRIFVKTRGNNYTWLFMTQTSLGKLGIPQLINARQRGVLNALQCVSMATWILMSALEKAAVWIVQYCKLVSEPSGTFRYLDNDLFILRLYPATSSLHCTTLP